MVIFFVGMITLQAQESLKVKFRSRALLDATLSGYGKESTQGYYRLEDFRVGFKGMNLLDIILKIVIKSNDRFGFNDANVTKF